MKTDKEYIDYLIISFLNHSLPEEDLKYLYEWAKERKENKEYLLSFQKTALLLDSRRWKKYNSRLAYQSFLKRQGKKVPNRLIRFAGMFTKYAAILVICCFAGLYFYSHFQPNLSKEKEIVVCIPNGEYSFFYLPDSTEVWLNAGSQFRYTTGYGINNRNVFLKGEAYFSVKKHRKLPFIVKTDSISVKVYGTKFSICNYPGMETVKVALEEGKIALNFSAVDSTLFVKPQEEIIYKKGKAGYFKKYIDNQNVAGWRKGNLRFDEESLGDIIQTLERQYNVNIQIEKSSYYKKIFYGSFSTRQSITEVLDIMCDGIDLQYSYKNNTYIIHSKK
ncbi:FecR family protein [Parabacteroides pacaensis]|uniref:FecR family protein n=1 Tax=Parabacteroides pacaensis TaxID=2086575 RepID=UPI000D1121B5|nr:FecR family protein [Parabacteroides pacaensis]